MDTTDIHPENAPLILGYDDGSPPVRVKATGTGVGFRVHEVFWVQGSDVDEELHRNPPLLVRFEGGPAGDPLADNVRPGDRIPELGIQTRAGTDADVTSFVQSVETDLPATREPDGPSSIHDEQSDKRPVERRRTGNPGADSAAIADSNEDAFAESFRDPEASGDTYDLDADPPVARPARRIRPR